MKSHGINRARMNHGPAWKTWHLTVDRFSDALWMVLDIDVAFGNIFEQLLKIHDASNFDPAEI